MLSNSPYSLLLPAPEDASPVSLKKQKPAKPAAESKKTTKPKAKKEEPVEEPAEEANDSEAEENDDALVLATTLDSEDDEVAEGASLFKEGQDVGKIPKVSKKVKDAAQPSGETGVIYIGRVPHGFYEYEMKQYFSQFGDISRLRLSRNKKTGASKHFAFVEFSEASTAEVVAKTMDNYLLFGHILKCKVIPKADVHDNLFNGANKRFKKVPWNKIAGKNLEKPKSETAWKNKISKEQTKRAKKAAQLKELGYDFDMPDLKDAPPPTKKAADEEAEPVKALPAAETATNGDEETPKKAAKKATKATKAKKAKA